MRNLILIFFLLSAIYLHSQPMMMQTVKPLDVDYYEVLKYSKDQTYTLPNEVWQSRQNELCDCLRKQGIIVEFDVFYVGLQAGDENMGKLNWKNPGTNIATETGTVNWSATTGFDNNTTSSYLNTNWNGSTDGVNWARDDASIWMWCNTTGTMSSSVIYGGFNSGSGYGTVVAFSGSNYETDLQEGNQATISGFANGSFLVSLDRAASGSWIVYENGTSQGTNSYTSTGEAAYDFYVFGLNLDGSLSNAIPAGNEAYLWAAGGSLAGLHDEAYTCFNAYINP